MFYAIYMHGNLPSGLCPRARACIIIFHKTLGLMLYLLQTQGFLVLHVYFIPLTNRVIKVIQYRKELYDFYYTLTTGILIMYRCACASEVYGSVFVCVPRCVCVCVCVCVCICMSVCPGCYNCSMINEVQVRVSIGF